MKFNSYRSAVIAAIIANIIWGAAAPIFKWSLKDIQPFTLAFFRFFIAALIILPFTLHKLTIRRKDIVAFIILAFFGFTLNISLFFVAMKMTSSINSPIIGSSGPVLLLLGSIIFLHEKPQKKMVLGMFLSLFGVLIIIIQPLLKAGIDGSTLGNILLFVSTIASTIYTILLKRITDRYDAMTITFWTFTIAALLFLPGVLFEIHQPHIMHFHLQGLIGILFGAVLSSAVAYILYTAAMKRIYASEIGLFMYVDPIITVAIAWPLLGEIPNIYYLIGSLFVFLGIFIAEERIHWHPLHKLKKRD